MAKRKTCGDCGTKEGQLHILGCDMERCPFCGNQLISCQCGYKKPGIDVSPGSWAYSHGLTEAQQEDWEKLLSDKGRIPFILYPNLCAKCGTLWPEMFVVPDAEWKHYIEPQMRREMLCEACYIQIKAWIDGEGLGPTRRRKQQSDPHLEQAARSQQPLRGSPSALLPVLEMGGWWTRSVVARANDAKCRERTPDRLREHLY
jgi:hypothetical protein